jgi:uroporphyrinogen-III decarboxylase
LFTAYLRQCDAYPADDSGLRSLCLELDHAVSIGEACRIVGSNIALWGNLDPIRVLAQGTPESVRHKAVETLRAVSAAGHRRFVLSSGCTLAVETPPENLDALMRSAQDAHP